MFSAAHRPPGPHAKGKPAASCQRSPGRCVARPRPPTRELATAQQQQQQQQRNMERLNKKIGTIKLASPIRKQGGHLRAHTSQGFGAPPAGAQDPKRIMPFQRKPAHIRAMEDCKRPALRPAPASARHPPPGSGTGAQAGSEVMARARSELSELRRQLGALTAGINFSQLDRVVAHWGEDVLEGLRHAFGELNQLSLSFSHLLGNASSMARAGDAGKSNCIQIKSAVVSLRAMCERLGEQPADLDVAAKIVRVAQQGLVEQMLSWAGECESAYEIILPERRIASKGAQPLHTQAAEQQRPSNWPSRGGSALSLRSRKQFVVQPRREDPSAAGSQVPLRAQRTHSDSSVDVAVGANHHRFRHPSPPVDDPRPSSGQASAPFTYASVPRSCKTLSERRDRLQRHRPPMLIIPA